MHKCGQEMYDKCEKKDFKSSFKGKTLVNKENLEYTVLDTFKINNYPKAHIRFKESGYENIVSMSSVIRNQVKNRLAPTLNDVGSIGLEKNE